MRRRSSWVFCFRAAALALPALVACASNGTDGGNAGDDNNSGQSGNNNGSSGAGNHNSNGASNGNSGNHNSNGASNGNASNGNGTGNASNGNTSNGNGTGSGNASNASSGGQTLSDGGMATGDAGKRTCAVASAAVVADFEDDALECVASNGFTGTLSSFADTSNGASNPVGAVVTGTDTSPSCNKYMLHSAQSIGAKGTYAGTRGDFLVHASAGSAPDAGLLSYPPPEDISKYSGISFDIKANSGTTSLTFEVVTEESQPSSAGGTAAVVGGDQYNNRGFLLSTTTSQTNAAQITSSWSTVYVPFGLLIPGWFPASGTSGCNQSSQNDVFCQAPSFNAQHALGFQFVLNPTESPMGAYDIDVDNITLYSGDNGLAPPNPPNNVMPSFKDGSMGSCTKPTNFNVAGKYLQWAYKNWYSRFVTSAGNGQLKVIRPENNNDTVSEGIAYGMLIAVYMNDSTLFSGLYAYWKTNATTGNLMNWDIPPGGNGSATDADQDAAFALIEAGTKFNNSSYTTDGTNMVKAIFSTEIDPNNHLPTGGSNYGKSATMHATDPSYFAPEYYPTFTKVDPGDPWGEVTTAVYTALNNVANSTTGLVPGWCQANGSTACAQPGMNTASTDPIYQYDAHRVPWRTGLDYCWNGNASAKSFLTKISSFFAGLQATSASTGGGLGQLVDQYQLNGTPASGASPNSMSLIGAAAVGAMSGSNANFVNAAWQFVLDGENRATLDVSTTNGSQSGYSYYNATVGLLTLLSMSGNFYVM